MIDKTKNYAVLTPTKEEFNTVMSTCPDPIFEIRRWYLHRDQTAIVFFSDGTQMYHSASYFKESGYPVYTFTEWQKDTAAPRLTKQESDLIKAISIALVVLLFCVGAYVFSCLAS